MKAMPIASAVKPARRTPDGFLRPISCPTRTVAAWPMPIGTMKVTAAMWIAM